MGNYVSCTLSTQIAKNSKAATKVIVPSGEIKQFDVPMKAAELMLETPNFFLVNTKSLHMGRRFSALNADEDLEIGDVYVMFPMKRLNSTVTPADMGALFLTASSAAKRVSGRDVRVQPTEDQSGELADDDDDGEEEEDNKRMENWMENLDPEAAKPKLNLDDIEDFSAPEFMHRVSMCRSKKPLLETIAEEPVSVCSSR